METKKLLEESRAWVRDQLEGSARFWLDHEMDKDNGGIYTCLVQAG